MLLNAISIILAVLTCAEAGLDYLDPILHEEQTPNGHYKYGYKSNKAIVNQAKTADGTAKGFYPFQDDYNNVQYVEYIAGNDGFKGIGDTSFQAPGYTPEVAAARKAHEEAYFAARRRAFSDRKLVIEARKKVVEDNKPLTIQIPLDDRPLESVFPISLTTNTDEINLFSGRPVFKPRVHHGNMYKVHNYFRQNTFKTTTAPPGDAGMHFFVIPTPTVHHYEKIWPLPPHKFKNLEVRVNGQDRNDPQGQSFNYALTNIPNKASFNLPPSNDLRYKNTINSFSSYNPAGVSNHFVLGFTAKAPQTLKIAAKPAATFQNLGDLSLSAHQVDLFRYSNGMPLTGNYVDNVVKNNFQGLGENYIGNKVDVKKSIVALAAQKAIDVYRQKYFNK